MREVFQIMTITCSILWLLLIRFISFTSWRKDRLLLSLWALTLYIFIDSLTLSFDEDDMALLVELLPPLLSFDTLCCSSCSTWGLDKTDVDDGPVSGSGYSDEPEWLMPSYLWLQVSYISELVSRFPVFFSLMYKFDVYQFCILNIDLILNFDGFLYTQNVWYTMESRMN